MENQFSIPTTNNTIGILQTQSLYQNAQEQAIQQIINDTRNLPIIADMKDEIILWVFRLLFLYAFMILLYINGINSIYIQVFYILPILLDIFLMVCYA